MAVFRSFSHLIWLSMVLPPFFIFGDFGRRNLQAVIPVSLASKRKSERANPIFPGTEIFSFHSAAAVNGAARLCKKVIHPILSPAATQNGHSTGFAHFHFPQLTQKTLRRGYKSGMAPGQGRYGNRLACCRINLLCQDPREESMISYPFHDLQGAS